MTYTEQLQADYAAIRRRLYAPARAVPDTQSKPVCRDIKIRKEELEPKPKKREYTIKEKVSRKTRRAATKARMLARRYNPKSLVANPHGIPWLDVANSVTKGTGVTLAEMQGDMRASLITAARMMLIYRLKTEITMNGKPVTNGWIGQKLNRDPSTIVHNLQKYARRHNLPLP